MFKLFKSTRIVFFVTYIILSVVYFVISMFFAVTEDSSNPFILLTIAYVIEMLLVGFVINIFAVKKHDKILQILNNECDPIKYLNAYYPLTQKKSHKKIKPLIFLNLSAGYISVGDFTQAKNVLASIDLKKANPMSNIMYHLHIVSLNINEGNFEEAGRILDYISNLISATKISSIYLETLNKARNLYAASIKIENGYFDEVEQVLLSIIATPECMCQKVSARYTLAQLYIKQNRTDEAVKEMSFVAENGNTLAIAQKAREFLNNYK